MNDRAKAEVTKIKDRHVVGLISFEELLIAVYQIGFQEGYDEAIEDLTVLKK